MKVSPLSFKSNQLSYYPISSLNSLMQTVVFRGVSLSEQQYRDTFIKYYKTFV